MKKIYKIAIAFLISINALGQTLTHQWSGSLGGPSNEQVTDIAYDQSNNVYVVGYFNGTIDLDPGAGVANFTSSSASDDIFIAKYGSNGAYIWGKTIGNTSTDRAIKLKIDNLGNLLFCGIYFLTVDFDPSAGVYNLTSGGGQSGFLSKFDPSGNLIYAKSFQGASAFLIINSLDIDANNNTCLIGTSTNTVDMDPGAGVVTVNAGLANGIIIGKYDALGNYIWAFSIASTGSALGGQDVSFDLANNIYVTGYIQGTNIDFNPAAGTYFLSATGGSRDIFLAKYSLNGGFRWANRFGASPSDGAFNNISTDNSANVYLATDFSSAVVDFDPGAGVVNLSNSGVFDIALCKYDSLGNYMYAKKIGGINNDIVYGSWTLPNGQTFITGGFQGTVDFDPGAGVTNLTNPSAVSYNTYLASYDAIGNLIFAVTFTASVVGNDEGYGVAATNAYCLLSGNFSGTIDFNQGVGVNNLTGVGGSDGFIAKYDYCVSSPLQPTSISGLASMCSGAGATSYSIATVAGATSYTWSLPGGWSGTSSTNTISATPGSSGIFTVTASNACGTSPQQTLIVSVNATPTITVNSGSICSGQSFTMVPGGASTYTIQGGSAVVSPVSNTSYTVTGTSTAGCVSANSATSNVTVNGLPTITVNSGSICSGNSFTMVPGGASTYTFQGGSAVVSPLSNTSYTVTGTSTAGCVSASSATSNVVVNATPTITVNSGSICSGNSFTMVPGGASTYTIQGGSTVVSPTATTNYTVIGTSTAGCVSANSATSNVVVNSTPTISVAGGAICPGGSFTFNPSGAATYTYSGGQVVSPGITTTYSITGTSTAGCVSQVALATVTVASNLTVTISGTNTICSGQPINLTAGGATTYTWNTGATTTTIAPTPTANITYSVIGASGSCSNTANISVTVNPLPTITANTNNTLICTGQSATLTASGASTYTWSPGGAGTSIVVSPTVNSTYTITGTNSSGCVNTSTFTQLVDPCLGISSITLTKEEVNIYPNPTSGEIIISVVSENTKIEIYSVLGELILTEKILPTATANLTLDLSPQPNGIYFIKIGNTTKKIIKQY